MCFRAIYSGDATYAGSASPELPLYLPPFRQYFAEGATGFFHTDVGLLNVSRTH
jgi:hypothetical protein